MKADNFDKEISELYQERKQQLTPPEIKLTQVQQTTYSRFSLARVAGILFAAGGASFGIMAIITHLANAPMVESPATATQHVIALADPVTDKKREVVIPVRPELPPQPVIKPPQRQLDIASVPNHQGAEPSELSLVLPGEQLVVLPQLTEPKLSIQPVHKVMPKYSVNALKSKQSGMVKLGYKISAQGEVLDIVVLTSDAARELQKSAKQALSKWQYRPGKNYQERYEIIFEFKLDRG